MVGWPCPALPGSGTPLPWVHIQGSPQPWVCDELCDKLRDPTDNTEGSWDEFFSACCRQCARNASVSAPKTASCKSFVCSTMLSQALPGPRGQAEDTGAPFSILPSAAKCIPSHPRHPQHSFPAAPLGAPERAHLQWLLATCSRHARLQTGPDWSLHFFLRHSLMACWKSPGTASSILYLTGFSSSPGPCQHLSSAKFP